MFSLDLHTQKFSAPFSNSFLIECEIEFMPIIDIMTVRSGKRNSSEQKAAILINALKLHIRTLRTQARALT
jgi:hypothetical protein